jgi:hypothetical protein
MQQAKETHQYDGYGVNSRMLCIIVDIVCIRNSLDSQDERKLLSHCCNKRQDCGKGDLEGELEVSFTGTELEPALVLHSLTLRFALGKVCLGAAFWGLGHGE